MKGRVMTRPTKNMMVVLDDLIDQLVQGNAAPLQKCDKTDLVNRAEFAHAHLHAYMATNFRHVNTLVLHVRVELAARGTHREATCVTKHGLFGADFVLAHLLIFLYDMI